MKMFLTLAIVALTALSAHAADDAAKGEKGARAGNLLGDIELTAAQKKEVREITKEYQPQLKALGEKAAAIVPQEVRQSAMKAVEDAKAAGTKGKELMEVRKSAMRLTEQQEQELAEVNSERQKIEAEMKEKLMSILTPEQKAQVKPAAGEKKGAGAKKAGAKKKKAAAE